MNGLRGLRLSAVVLAGGLIVTGCGGVERDASGRVTKGGDLSIFKLRTGDCFNGGSAGEEIGDVPAVPCERPHDNEVFAVLTHPAASGDAFPGREGIVSFAEPRCVQAFADYVGEDYGTSVLEIALVPPKLRSWTEKDDRTIACVLHGADGERLTGSQKA